MFGRQLPRLTVVVALVSLSVATAVAGIFGHRTRPTPRAGIPKADYQYRSQSATKTVVSQTGVLIKKHETESGRTRVDVNGNIDDSGGTQLSEMEWYQLDRKNIEIDHCSISRVVFQLRRPDRWVLSLRADQNHQPADADDEAFNPKLWIKRNQFHVTVRCYGQLKTPVENLDEAAGRPLLLELAPEPFWVQRGVPSFKSLSGTDDHIEEIIDLVDRVEIEFYYR